MPTFRLETEDGEWLQDMRLRPPDWKPGDRISRGRDQLEVVAVNGATLVVRGDGIVVRRHVPSGG